MKKLVILAASLLAVACSKVENEVKPAAPQAATATNLQSVGTNTAGRIRVRLMHGGSCSNPLGVCIMIPLKQAGISDDPKLGTATAALLDEKSLLITFDQNAALENGIVPITDDIIVNDFLEHKEIVVHPGKYQAEFSKEAPYGQIVADVAVKD